MVWGVEQGRVLLMTTMEENAKGDVAVIAAVSEVESMLFIAKPSLQPPLMIFLSFHKADEEELMTGL